MKILENIPLNEYTTMAIGGPARYFVEITNEEELQQAVHFADEKSIDWYVIGGGSNLLASDDGFDGLVIKNSIEAIVWVESNKASPRTYICGAGTSWDKVVAEISEAGYTGVEALSLIPGTMGGAVVQNIGAYGQELADTFLSLRAYDVSSKKIVTIKKDDCQFRYRDSIFKSTHPASQKGQYIILTVSLKVARGQLEPPFYENLQKYFDAHEINDYTPQNVRDAVVAWRREYLPDPQKVPNTGSFFRNPLLGEKSLELLKRHLGDELQAAERGGFEHIKPETGKPHHVVWEVKTPDASTNEESEQVQYKVSAGWLLEVAGFLDYQDPDTGVQTGAKNALLVTNPDRTSATKLLRVTSYMQQVVLDMLGVELEMEPEIISNS